MAIVACPCCQVDASCLGKHPPTPLPCSAEIFCYRLLAGVSMRDHRSF